MLSQNIDGDDGDDDGKDKSDGVTDDSDVEGRDNEPRKLVISCSLLISNSLFMTSMIQDKGTALHCCSTMPLNMGCKSDDISRVSSRVGGGDEVVVSEEANWVVSLLIYVSQ